MPPEFSKFLVLNPETFTLDQLSDGPGEQPLPVILSTENGDYAMGIYSPENQVKGYGRWRFSAEKVVKWNCVFRVQNPKPGGEFSFRHFVAVGTLENVRAELARLVRARGS